MIPSTGLVVCEVGSVHKKIIRLVVHNDDHKNMSYNELN